jgi:hypothetical protein
VKLPAGPRHQRRSSIGSARAAGMSRPRRRIRRSAGNKRCPESGSYGDADSASTARALKAGVCPPFMSDVLFAKSALRVLAPSSLTAGSMQKISRSRRASGFTQTQHYGRLRSLVVTLLLSAGFGGDRPVASLPGEHNDAPLLSMKVAIAGRCGVHPGGGATSNIPFPLPVWAPGVTGRHAGCLALLAGRPRSRRARDHHARPRQVQFEREGTLSAGTR